MDLWALWGKTHKGSAGEVWVHPLLCHMIDVAEVTGLLWERSLGAGMRGSLAQAFACTEPEVQRTLQFWAALHDLGKASPAFQRRYAPAMPRLEREGLSFRRTLYDRDEGAWHGIITARTLPPLLEACGLPRLLAKDLARGLGGHHGAWPPPTEAQHLKSDHLGDATWDAARSAMVESLATLYEPVVPAAPLLDRAQRQSLVALISGLVAVADWIGSMEEHFGAQPETSDALAYRHRAMAQAAEAVHALRWDAWQAPDAPATFHMLFPSIEANSVQRVVSRLAPLLSEPSLVLIEAPTGSGKTEAALHLADHLAVGQQQRGLYIAMPTTATSNAMYLRLQQMLDARYGPGHVAPLLVHSQALWREPPPPVSSEHEGDQVRGVEEMSWFLPRKRSLLAPFGVGTVDQALLGVLLTRHFFVRLFGLAHKTVIFDEVHAYDTYMSTLFARLLAWLRAQGTSVILLSATLPAVTRRALLEAWGARDGPASQAYPAITWACGKAGGVLAAQPPPDHTVHLERLDRSPAALVAALREGLAEGGCAAVLCNTVARAQEVYRLLREAALVPEEDLTLFHARFPLAWRQEIEGHVDHRYGKKSCPEVRRGIVVATQVIEQSLDLDFDLMVSDLAPMDLMLQRAGRLHRHQRERPAPLREPRLLWVEPEQVEDLPAWDNDRFVYEPYILLRTWLALQGCEAWQLPSQTRRLIEAVYGSDDPALEGALRQALERYREEWAKGLREDAQKASMLLVLPPADEDLLVQRNPMLAEDNPEAHASMRARTRLGEEGLQVICLHRTPEGLATDPEGGVLIDLERPPAPAEMPHLARASLQVATRGLVQALLANEPPSVWRKDPFLRYARPVIFEAGEAHIAGEGGAWALHLDRQEGLRVERQH